MLTPLILANIARLSYEKEDKFKSEIINYVIPSSIDFCDASINNYSDAQMYILNFEEYIIFTIRGTSNIKDGITDINLLKDRFQDVQYCNYVDSTKYKNIQVHRGFLDQYNTVKFHIISHIFQRLWSNPNKQIKVIFTSHSLGAAISTLACATLKAHLKNRVFVENWLFGCPRVGNEHFVNFYNDNVDLTNRYICGNDLVTRVPRIGYTSFKHYIQLSNPNEGSFLSRNFGSIKDHYMISYIKCLEDIENNKNKYNKIDEFNKDNMILNNEIEMNEISV